MKFRDFHYFLFEQVGDLLYNYKMFCTTKSCFYFIQYKIGSHGRFGPFCFVFLLYYTPKS